jgi:hypothetical protein
MGASADARPRLENGHTEARRDEPGAGRKPGGAGSNDDDIETIGNHAASVRFRTGARCYGERDLVPIMLPDRCRSVDHKGPLGQG